MTTLEILFIVQTVCQPHLISGNTPTLQSVIENGQTGYIHSDAPNFLPAALDKVQTLLGARARADSQLLHLYGPCPCPAPAAAAAHAAAPAHAAALAPGRFHVVFVPLLADCESLVSSFLASRGDLSYVELVCPLTPTLLPPAPIPLPSVAELRQHPVVATVAAFSPVATRADTVRSLDLGEILGAGAMVGVSAEALFLESAYTARLTDKFGD